MSNTKRPVFNADAAEEYFSDLLFYYKTFCPKCGSPFTDEAVQMVMERMEKMYEQTSN